MGVSIISGCAGNGDDGAIPALIEAIADEHGK